ncbi:MAG: hypothetical protein FJ303_22930 [Planctomycetes bacterium]|nr:hypothetical protein [Planctomycetota bacterium]
MPQLLGMIAVLTFFLVPSSILGDEMAACATHAEYQMQGHDNSDQQLELLSGHRARPVDSAGLWRRLGRRQVFLFLRNHVSVETESTPTAVDEVAEAALEITTPRRTLAGITSPLDQERVNLVANPPMRE